MDKYQKQHVRTIIQVCKAHETGKPKNQRHAFRLAVLCVMTSAVESNLLNYASANVPKSVEYPHQPIPWEPDGLGHDHASMGLYQQQTGTAWTPAGYGRNMDQTTMDSPNGWGPPWQLMSARISTHKFIRALESRVPEWPHATSSHLGEVCQTVQGSAFPDRYAEQRRRAHRLVLTRYMTVRNPKRPKPNPKK